MSNGVLRLPGSNEKVDVVYKAPRMICASEHTIKLYTAEVISANSKRFSFFWLIRYLSIRFACCIYESAIQ